MKKANFEELNKSQIEKMGKFLLIQEMLQLDIRQKDINILKERKLNFYAFSVGEYTNDFNIKTQFDLLKKFEQMVSNKTKKTLEQVELKI